MADRLDAVTIVGTLILVACGFGAFAMFMQGGLVDNDYGGKDLNIVVAAGALQLVLLGAFAWAVLRALRVIALCVAGEIDEKVEV